MEEIKTQAIVLKSSDYKEGGKLLTLFSVDYGLITAKIKGVTKPKSKLAFAAQPLCFGEYILVEKYGYTVINCTSIESFYSLSKDFDKFISASGMLEIVSIIVKEQESNAILFVELLKALKMLEYSNAVPLAVFIKFFIDSLNVAGYKLGLDKCLFCGDNNSQKYKFSFSHGGLACAGCGDANSISLSQGEVAVLKNINMTEMEDLEKLRFIGVENLCSVVKVLNKYFSDKTGEVLKAVKDYI
ncbi:MAG: DNA repair protein RecO [Clostridia bacterium]|nr:DNA repair protein RecO [Clostridia bacterium]